MRNEDKYTKLAHYMSRKLNRFIQYDGYKLGPHDAAYEVDPDEKGRCVMFGVTHELMHNGSDVRVLVPPDAKKDAVVELLMMIAETIQSQDYIDPDAKKAAEEDGSIPF